MVSTLHKAHSTNNHVIHYDTVYLQSHAASSRPLPPTPNDNIRTRPLPPPPTRKLPMPPQRSSATPSPPAGEFYCLTHPDLNSYCSLLRQSLTRIAAPSHKIPPPSLLSPRAINRAPLGLSRSSDNISGSPKEVDIAAHYEVGPGQKTSVQVSPRPRHKQPPPKPRPYSMSSTAISGPTPSSASYGANSAAICSLP